MKNKTSRFLFLLLSCLAIVMAAHSCSRLIVEKPEGFAEMKKDNSYHAISPEGLLYRVRYVENYPKKDLAFWREALKNQLVREGYQPVDEQEFDAPGREGVLFEWGAPYGNENFIYLTAIAVFGDSIAVAEAAGEYNLYGRYREALMDSLKTISLR
ncbi:MAG: hypothetical protein JW881_06790 [Spirochaetales bacterium]|nr:hypothetical protein [Spirochaetales bacterium]